MQDRKYVVSYEQFMDEFLPATKKNKLAAKTTYPNLFCDAGTFTKETKMYEWIVRSVFMQYYTGPI